MPTELGHSDFDVELLILIVKDQRFRAEKKTNEDFLVLLRLLLVWFKGDVRNAITASMLGISKPDGVSDP